MKKIIFVFLAFFFVSCSNIMDGLAESKLSAYFSGIPLCYYDFSSIENIDEIPLWIRSRVSYEITNETLSPEELLKRGKGDCDGYALLYMNIAYIRFGMRCSLCLVDLTDRKIVNGGSINHAVIRFPDGTLIDPQNGDVVFFDVGYEYSFSDVFKE